MDKRIKDLEMEVCYLRKELEELKEKIPEVHYHYTYDLSNMNPTLIASQSILDKFGFKT